MSVNKNKPFSPFLKQCFVTATMCISAIGHACGVGFIAILAPQASSPSAALTLTPDELSWSASISGPTLLLGNLLTIPVMSKFGRRSTMQFVDSSALAGWLIMIMASNFEVFFIGRTIQCLSLSIVLSLRSVMLGEYTSPGFRGAFLTCITFGHTFGIFIVHLLGSFISWQMTGLIVTLVFFVVLIMTIYIPESPSFLASKERYDECRKAFRLLRPEEEEPELQTLIESCMLYNTSKTSEKSSRQSFVDNLKIIKKPELYKPIIVMIHVYLLAHFSCSNYFSNYPMQIIGGLMAPGTNVAFWMVFLDAQRLLCNFLTVFITNKINRRTMLFSTTALCIFSIVAIAAYVLARAHDMLFYDAAWIPILLINLQVLTIGLGMVPLPGVIGGEVFPLQHRGIGSSISMAVLSVAIFISLKTFPFLLRSIGLQGLYLCCAIILIYCSIVIWYLLPETKGYTLQEIENVFRGVRTKSQAVEYVTEKERLDEVSMNKLLLRKASIHSYEYPI